MKSPINWRAQESRKAEFKRQMEALEIKYQPKLETEFCDIELKAVVHRYQAAFADGYRE